MSVVPAVELSASVVSFRLTGNTSTTGAKVTVFYENTTVATKVLGTTDLLSSGSPNVSLACTLPPAGTYTLSARVTSPAGVEQTERLVHTTDLVVESYRLPDAAVATVAAPLVRGTQATVSVVISGSNAEKLTASLISVRLGSGSTGATTTAYDAQTRTATATVTPTGVGATSILVRIVPPVAGSASSTELVALSSVVVRGAPVTSATTGQLAYGAPVGALDVVGKNLQLRLGVYLRAVVQQQVVVLLEGQGFLGVGADHDLAVEYPAGLPVKQAFVHFVAGAMRHGVVNKRPVVHVFLPVNQGEAVQVRLGIAAHQSKPQLVAGKATSAAKRIHDDLAVPVLVHKGGVRERIGGNVV
jgi:hypothetical protein